MKKSSAFIIAIISLIFGFVISMYFRSQNLTTETKTTTTKTTKIRKTKKNQRTMQESLNDQIKNTSATWKKDAPLEAACLESYETFVSSDLDEVTSLVEDHFRGGELLTPECLAGLSKRGHPFKNIDKVCDGNSGSLKECQGMITWMRARGITEMMDKTLPIEKWTESEMMNTVLWNFVKDQNPSLQSLRENQKYLNELLELTPDSYAVNKAQFVHLLLEQLIHKQTGNDESLGIAYERLMEFDGVEKDVENFPLIKPILQGDVAGYDQMANQWIQDYPQNPAGYYAKAHVAWKSSKREETISYLEEAVRLNPEDKNYQESLVRARTGKFDEPIFLLSFGFNFDQI